MEKEIFCSDCAVRTCNRVDGELPKFCQCLRHADKRETSVKAYVDDPVSGHIMRSFAAVDQRGVTGEQSSRLEMLIKLMHRMEVRRVGIASCYAFLRDARTLARILRVNGFEVFGINCRVGKLNKQADLCIAPENDKAPDITSCNPIMQADILNGYKTEYNIILGLCVGHDAVFARHSEAPVSTLVAKDFALGHNPLPALRDEAFSSLLTDPLE